MVKMALRCFLHALLLGVLQVTAFELGDLLPTGITKHAVEDLTDKNFHDFTKAHPVTAMLFYAPWCYYSQQVMPAWDTAAQKLEMHDPPVVLAKVDASKYRTIGEEYQIQAFPTLKLIIDGSVHEYDGQGRSWQSIVKWVNKHTERDHVLSKAEDVERFLHDNDLAAIGVFADSSHSSTFKQVANHFDDVMFAEVDGKKISEDVSKSMARHAALLCETISVGKSTQLSKQLELPREHMHCDGSPRNPQRPDWSDRFAASVEGKMLTVNRTDQPHGWDQLLALKCCDDEEKSTAAHPSFPVPSIVMFFPHDERYAIYDGNMDDTKAIERFISGRRVPTVMRLSPETADKILGSEGGDTLPVLFLIQREDGSSEEKVLREAAKQLRGRVSVCTSGMSDQIEQRTMQMAGVDQDSGSVITIVETHGRQEPGGWHSPGKYRMPSLTGLTAQKIIDFVGDYEGGKLRPYLRSEAEPTPEEIKTGGPVGVLVGTTFTKVAHDTTKDVLVDFYAPWCGHCRKFEPQYKILAKKLKHVSTLRIMKLDATRNEVEGMTIQGFPTIVLFKASDGGAKEQAWYSGSREPDDMVNWLKDQCSHKFSEIPPPKPKAEASDAPVEQGLLDPDEEDL